MTRDEFQRHLFDYESWIAIIESPHASDSDKIMACGKLRLSTMNIVANMPPTALTRVAKAILAVRKSQLTEVESLQPTEGQP